MFYKYSFQWPHGIICRYINNELIQIKQHCTLASIQVWILISKISEISQYGNIIVENIHNVVLFINPVDKYISYFHRDEITLYVG